jgi:hypothetical protein
LNQEANAKVVQLEGGTYELYEPGIGKRRTDLGVTIQKGGIISMSPATGAALNDPKAVQLLYSSDQNVIAIKRAEPGSRYALSVSRQGRKTTYALAGKSFLDTYGIPHERSKRYPAKQLGDTLLVDLNQKGVDVGHRSPKHG